MGELHEKCAVVAVTNEYSDVDAAGIAFLALDVQQHRGDAGSGMAGMSYAGQFECYTGLGLVKDVYTPEVLGQLAGSSIIGQNRYPTSGGHENHDQPVDDKALRFALGHNGNLSVLDPLKAFLEKSNINVSDVNDTELMTFSIAQLMREGRDLPDAIAEVYPMLKGAYSCVASHGGLVVAFRDPLGIRPLSLGQIEGGYMVSSETCGFYPARAKNLGDVVPGGMVIMTDGSIERRQVVTPNPKLDIFEVVYFASKDSEMFGESIGQMRYRLGQELAEQYPLEGDNYLVTGVPDSATPIAEGYAHSQGVEHREIIVKNRFRGGRSFQQRDQATRRRYLDIKFSYVSGVADGRDVIVIDDSIVRLNTATKINEMLMRAGALSVTFLVGSPPIGFPDFSGIDTPNQDRLIAANKTPEQIREKVGCKSIGYLALSRMIRATGQPADRFNLASFTGEYPYDIGGHQKNIARPVSYDYLEEAASSLLL